MKRVAFLLILIGVAMNYPALEYGVLYFGESAPSG